MTEEEAEVKLKEIYNQYAVKYGSSDYYTMELMLLDFRNHLHYGCRDVEAAYRNSAYDIEFILGEDE